MARKVFVVGVGMTEFFKINTGGDYTEFAKVAVEEALEDARVKYEDIDQAICAFNLGKSTSGQRVLYQIGMTGIPIHNVNNNCAAGSTGIYLGKQLIKGNISNVVLVLGFEKMQSEFLKDNYKDRSHPLDKHRKMVEKISNDKEFVPGASVYEKAAVEHMKKYGTTKLHIAKVAAKNHRHGARNNRSFDKTVYNVDEILNSTKVYGPLTKLECCEARDGAAAVVLMSEEAVLKFKLQDKAVEILGIEMATDSSNLFKGKSIIKLAGFDMTDLAARRLYHKTKVSPKDIGVVELHDCTASNEVVSYEGLQLCGVGEAGKFVDDGDNTYGGRVVVNPSGGLIGRGHPLGATGVAQCAELVWQLRGEAGIRQVNNAKLALQHNMAVGGATIVALYRRGFHNAEQSASINSKL